MRFGERTRMDIIKEFNKPRQEGSVKEYQTRFEELKSLVIISYLTLNEAYFVSSFVTGLNDELKLIVKMMQPETVQQAAKKVRMQELALVAIFKRLRTLIEGYPLSSQEVGENAWTAASGLTQGKEHLRVHTNLNAAKPPIMEPKRRPRLSFKCGDKFSLGHQCRRQLLNMEGLEEDNEVGQPTGIG